MSRSCGKASEQVYLYLDQEMSRFRSWQIRRHLRKCEDCCGKFDFETHFKAVIREKTATDAPPELIHRLHAFLEEHGADDPQV